LAIFVDLIDCSLRLSMSTRLGKEMSVSTVVSRSTVDSNELARPINVKILFHFLGKHPSEFLRDSSSQLKIGSSLAT